MTLYFSRPTFWSADTAVLSLHVANGTPLDVYCQSDMLDATTGHLEIDLDVEALVATDDDTAGATVLKGVYGKTLTRGPVVEGIKAGSANVSLTSDLGALPESGVAQGIVTISVDSSVSGAELAVQTVRVDGVTDELYEDVIALAFPCRPRLRVFVRVCTFQGPWRCPRVHSSSFDSGSWARAAGDIL
jgi:hypothetical protein